MRLTCYHNRIVCEGYDYAVFRPSPPRMLAATAVHEERSPRARVLIAVTVPAFADVLMRGQFAWLKKRGWDITLVSSPGPELATVARREGVAVEELSMSRYISLASDLRALWSFISLLRRRRPQLTHVNTPKAGFIGELASVLTGVPCRVYTLMGLRLETARGFQRAVLWFTEWVACRCAHVVIAVSPSLAERAVAVGVVRRRKVLTFGLGSNNGVDAARFIPTPERIAMANRQRRAWGIVAEAPVIGFVGRIVDDKGIKELIEAFQVVRAARPDAQLLMVGGIEPGLSATTQATLDSPGIVVTNLLEDTNIAHLVIDVLVLPTYREGFPNVPLEAAAAERPVVTTTATGAVNSVIDGKTGLLVPPGDPDSLAKAILMLIENPERARTMGRAGRQWVESEFRQERIWQDIENTYVRLLTDRSGRGGLSSTRRSP